MYSYIWDEVTGGLLLTSVPLKFSKEPRPVYYQELDILGFDKHWIYKKSDAFPYMWAEANTYWYRGRKVAQTKGGSLYTAPELILIDDPEPGDQPLRFVDIPAMVDKNRELIEKLSQDTVKKIYNTYIAYKDKVDIFYVAFSGGKDSIVLLDLVQQAIPHNELKVLFGDTGMEFPDTYSTVDVVENMTKSIGIEFIRAKSEFNPEYTWDQFGPPATVTRWCCSVHKTVPQIIALRSNLGKADFTGCAFIGVRASESIGRSDYDYISIGEKHKGQYNCNPIIEWNSAEVFLQVFERGLPLNDAYKKGNRRAGCLICPRAAEKNEYISNVSYPEETEKLVRNIRKQYSGIQLSESKLTDFIEKGGWKARKNGRDILAKSRYFESSSNNAYIIKVIAPTIDWRIWMKTIGELLNDTSPYRILFRNTEYTFNVKENRNGYDVSFNSSLLKENPLFVKVLKNVFRKSASCIGCKTCEANCHNGYISMLNGEVHIDDRCVHCLQCHQIEKGCIVYKSLESPKGGINMKTGNSLNCYSHHAPKYEWLVQFFNLKNEFDQKHSLGSQMYSFFRRFLRDAKLLDEGGYSHIASIVESIGLEEESSWAIMLVNLSYSMQVNWFVSNIEFNEDYNKEYTLSLLVNDGAKESWVNDVWSSFGRLLDLPFNNVGMGSNCRENKHIVAIRRIPWRSPDPRVILYSLFKFSEACGDYHAFTLSRLMNHDIDSDGVSPTQIFGLGREEMEKLLVGLSINYPDFINTAFMLGLDNITLNKDKSAQDVLTLF